MPYVTYLRKSRADLDLERAGGEDTLSRHRRTLRDLADRMGLQVVAVYEELVSGDSISARPQMQRLLNEVQEGAWEGVLVMEVERLARGDTMDQGLVANAFKYSGTKIITPVKVYDPASDIDEEYFEFSLFMSRREYKTINRRMREGKRAAMREGKFASSVPPFGYDRVKLRGQKGYTLSPNADADTVRMMFDLYLRGGVNLYGIAKRLNEMGVFTQRGNKWTEYAVRGILQNIHYAGYTVNVRRPTQKVIRDGSVKRVRPLNKDLQYYKALHEPLVSKEDFDRAQHMMEQQTKSRAPRVYGFQNPLNGLVICDQCGRTMHRLYTPSSGRENLKCPNQHCKTVMHPLPEIEKMILKALRDWRFDVTAEEAADTESQARLDALAQKKDRLESALSALRQRETRTYELLEEGIYTPTEFTKRRAQIAQESDVLLSELSSVAADIAAIKTAIANQQQLVPRVDHVLAIYEQTQDKEERNRLLKSVLQKVVYHKTIRATKKMHETDLSIDIYPNLTNS